MIDYVKANEFLGSGLGASMPTLLGRSVEKMSKIVKNKVSWLLMAYKCTVAVESGGGGGDDDEDDDDEGELRRIMRSWGWI